MGWRGVSGMRRSLLHVVDVSMVCFISWLVPAPPSVLGFEQPIMEGGSALFKKFNVWFIMAGTPAGWLLAKERKDRVCLTQCYWQCNSAHALLNRVQQGHHQGRGPAEVS